jgi:hypothetical protein
MKTKNPLNIDEINLITLMQIIWEGKFKIILMITVSIIILFSFNNKKLKVFIAKTEIKPIIFVEAYKYDSLNLATLNIKEKTLQISKLNDLDNLNKGTVQPTKDIKNLETLNIIKVMEILTKNNISKSSEDNKNKKNIITKDRLLNLYVDILKNKSVFQDAIIKFNLLDANEFSSEQEYNEKVIELASSIKILTEIKETSFRKTETIKLDKPIIEFEYNDVEKWLNALQYVDKTANRIIRQNLLNQYQNIILDYKLAHEFFYEDTLMKIENLIFDYERETSDRISYLQEQSLIAKTLGIKKNTIEVQTFGESNPVISSIRPDNSLYLNNSLYLRGYEAIDKEIELIQGRGADKKAFINGLFDMEKQKRNIEQDKTLDRFNIIFDASLLVNDRNFIAASSEIYGTKFINQSKKDLLLLAIAIGLAIGLFSVFFAKALQSKIFDRKK